MPILDYFAPAFASIVGRVYQFGDALRSLAITLWGFARSLFELSFPPALPLPFHRGASAQATIGRLQTRAFRSRLLARRAEPRDPVPLSTGLAFAA